VKLPPVSFRAQVNPEVIVSMREVVARLGTPGVRIVDARTEKEFNGGDIRALRGGHIPGAVNIPYEANWVDPDTPLKLQRRQVAGKDGMSLKPAQDLRALYARLDPEKETIVYCQSGVRAAETATVLQSLGFRNVKVYDSSWLATATASTRRQRTLPISMSAASTASSCRCNNASSSSRDRSRNSRPHKEKN